MKALLGMAVCMAALAAPAMAVELEQKSDMQRNAQLLGLNAATIYDCVGPVNYLSIDISGTVWVNGIVPAWLGVCSTSQTLNNFSPESCKYVHATLLAAQVAKKTVKLTFNDGGNCQSHGDWTVGGLFYVQINP